MPFLLSKIWQIVKIYCQEMQYVENIPTGWKIYKSSFYKEKCPEP